MKIFVFALLVLVSNFVYAKELLSFDTTIGFSVCDKAGACQLKEGQLETLKVELGDQTVLSKEVRATTDGFMAIISVDISRNYIKPYGVRFRYDYCLAAKPTGYDCTFLKEGMGHILVDDLKGLTNGQFLFMGTKHQVDDLVIKPRIKIQNIQISTL